MRKTTDLLGPGRPCGEGHDRGACGAVTLLLLLLPFCASRACWPYHVLPLPSRLVGVPLLLLLLVWVRAARRTSRAVVVVAMGGAVTFSGFVHDLVEHLRECYQTPAEQVEVRLDIARFTRTAAYVVSAPVDIAMLGTLDSGGGEGLLPECDAAAARWSE